MKKFKINGTTYNVANKWSEVTVGHFISKEFLSGNAIQLLSVLSGVPAKDLANTKEDLSKDFEEIVGFLKEDPLGWKGKGSSKTLTILDVECKIPKNLELQSFGQKIMFGQAISKSTWHYDVVPEAIAIYLAPQIYPDDWFERIDEVADAVKELPIGKVWSIADFFLRTTLEFRKDGKEP